MTGLMATGNLPLRTDGERRNTPVSAGKRESELEWSPDPGWYVI
ncbi:hypothetical protein SAMN05443545_101233 [Aidingimonas halophila]|uniref:Uncharacterized protein n=1 Tax=Aidingimonas halophila TaxID=574349 RepID=A0A1H2R5G3_9GAMM|nr:hypothetical protein SAMN05443545_101233 [Aidingimonas halophila]